MSFRIYYFLDQCSKVANEISTMKFIDIADKIKFCAAEYRKQLSGKSELISTAKTAHDAFDWHRCCMRSYYEICYCFTHTKNTYYCRCQEKAINRLSN